MFEVRLPEPAPLWTYTTTPLVPPMVSFETVSLDTLNRCLVDWGHKMGPLARGDQGAWCYALLHEGQPVAVVAASHLIAGRVAGYTRDQAVELSRLCASRRDLNRVALRLWREFVFPYLGFAVAVSYQDADLHTGDIYRFDGWRRYSDETGKPIKLHSGKDTRSQRPGRDKYVWVWEAGT